MKKLVSVILAICLLALGMSFAAADEKIYNNGEAPELIKVSDVQGNVVVVETGDGNLNIVSVVDRYEASSEIEELLNTSLAVLMEGNYSADAATLIVTDLFHVEIPEEYAGLLADGGMVEMVFKPLIMSEVSELVVLTSVDGQIWTEVPSVSADGTVTFAVDQSCAVAFAVPNMNFVPVNDADDTKQEANPNFTPSVTGKPDPKLVKVEMDGETGVALITTLDGEVVELITDPSTVVVTSLFERVYNPDAITYAHLQWAYDTICAAPNLGSIRNADGENTVGDEINSRLEGTGLNCADMTVSDLFEVTMYGSGNQQLQNGNLIEVTLERNFRKDDIVMVLYAVDAEHWQVLDDQYVTINEDGTVTLSLERLGVFALLVERLEADVVEGAVTAP